MDPLAYRVATRFDAAYKRPTNMVPVENQDSERIVYVLPETLKEQPGEYKKIPESQLDTNGQPSHPRHPGQPELPRKPKKPHKPEIPRDPPPAPIHPPIPPKTVLPPKRPKPVKRVKPVKVPEPSPRPKWEKRKRFLHPTAAERVAARFLLADC